MGGEFVLNAQAVPVRQPVMLAKVRISHVLKVLTFVRMTCLTG